MEEMVKNAEVLLQQVSELNKKHEEIARITGEKFNIFSILGVETKETSTHSAFLVELLDPNGSHGQDRLFLDLFVTMLRKKFPQAKIPVFENTKVEKEKYIGVINETYTEGGRADIVISGSSGSICIENKINAGDQKNQLIRYWEEYGKDGENGMILYLTLNGDEATKWSTETEQKQLKLDSDYYRISYKEHMLGWLEECHRAAIEVPLVREGIKHYMHLIKKLTGQDMSKQQKSEVIELLTKPEFLDTAWKIASSQAELKAEIFRQLLDKLESDRELNDTFEMKLDSDFGNKIYSAIRFSRPNWMNCIEFSFENIAGTDFGVGVKSKTKELNRTANDEKLQLLLKKSNIGKEYQHKDWIWATDLSSEWNNITPKISTEGFDLIKNTVIEISKRIEQFEKDAT